MPERCAFGIQIAIDTFKRHKSLAIDQIRTGVIQTEGSSTFRYIYINVLIFFGI